MSLAPTIVTAFFDIGRGNLPGFMHGRALPFYQHRSVNTYFDFFENLAKIENDMIIYTTPNFKDRVLEIRAKYSPKARTVVHTAKNYHCDAEGREFLRDFSAIHQRVKEVQTDPAYYQRVVNPQLIEYWHTDYVLVNLLKSIYATHAIDNYNLTSDLVAWIDFGYCRSYTVLPKFKTWNCNFDPDKIHLFNQYPIDYRRPISDIIYTGDVYIQGCHIVAGKERWSDLRELILLNLRSMLGLDVFGNDIVAPPQSIEIGRPAPLMDDDQTFLLLSFFKKPSIFTLHENSPDDWFSIFKKHDVTYA